MNRFSHIDFIRSISIVGFIAIHVLSYNLTNPLNTFLWNWLHFVVGGFVFCSGYVLAKYEGKLEIWEWLKRRVVRLLAPYYLYIAVHFLLVILLPAYFSGIGLNHSLKSLLSSVFFLEGGTNFSWLPLLFLELTILFPFLALFKRKKVSNWYVLFSLIITLFFSVRTFPYDFYRLVMWIPWSLVFILGIEFYKSEQKAFSIQRYINLAVISGIIFLESSILWNVFHKSTNLIDNKYPPNMYDLSYEVFGTAVLALLAKRGAIYSFLSRYSYSIFFVHIIVLDFVLHIRRTLGMNIVSEFLLVFCMSVFIAYLLNKVKVLYTGRHQVWKT